MDQAQRLALDGLRREAEIRAQERQEAERIAMRMAYEKAKQAADLQRAQMKQWQEEARRGR